MKSDYQNRKTALRNCHSKRKKKILLLKKNAQELNNGSVNFIGDESIKMISVIRLRVKNREASEKNQVFISRGNHAC